MAFIMLKIFVLNIEKLIGLPQDDSIRETIGKLIDSERQKKLKLMSKNQAGAASCEGAGLLLQYAAQWYLKDYDGACCDEEDEAELTHISLDEIISKIGAGIRNNGLVNLEYYKNKDGKPYWNDDRLPYFNLSHSGNFVAIALSEHEVGIDIQKKSINKSDRNQSMAERFFASTEARAVASADDKESVFYRLWARKEAVGKCIGIGVRPYLDVDMIHLPDGFSFYEDELLSAGNVYYLTACVKK